MAVYDHNYPDGGPDGSFNVACARFSTLDVFHSDLQQMEIGWQVVPNNDQTCPIDVQHPQLPVFVALKTYGTLTQQQTCLSPTPLVSLPTGGHSMKVVDPAKDGNWVFYLDGDAVATGVTTWTQGWVIANTEQHDIVSDSAYGDFAGLKFVNSSGEQPWNLAEEFIDCSSSYDARKVNGNDDHLQMSRPGGHTSGGCP